MGWNGLGICSVISVLMKGVIVVKVYIVGGLFFVLEVVVVVFGDSVVC